MSDNKYCDIDCEGIIKGKNNGGTYYQCSHLTIASTYNKGFGYTKSKLKLKRIPVFLEFDKEMQRPLRHIRCTRHHGIPILKEEAK